MSLVLVAPDKFKGCLRAPDVARALGTGIRRAGHEVRLLPLADGGEGTLQVALRAGYRRHHVNVAGPTGGRVEATIAFDGETAIVELADTCGFVRLPQHRPAPMTSTTVGLGEAVLAALALQPARIVMALGGSASIDGGMGLLAALGAQLTDASGAPVPLGGEGLQRLHRLDLSAARAAIGDVELIGATDVTSPLTGHDGAAHVFAPQKGADPRQVAVLDAGLRNFADHAGFPADLPGAGAAGGVGYAVLLLGGDLTSGAEFVLDLVGFDDALADADLVVTGEGRLDDTSVRGKLVGAVSRRAMAVGRPVVAVVGNDTRKGDEPRGVDVISLTDLVGDTSGRPAAARAALAQAGEALAARTAPAAVEPLSSAEEQSEGDEVERALQAVGLTSLFDRLAADGADDVPAAPASGDLLSPDAIDAGPEGSAATA